MPRSHVQLLQFFSEEEDNYLDACCRIRDISRAELMRSLLYTITREQLVLSILDDDSRRQELQCAQKRYRKRWGNRGRAKVKKGVFAGLRQHEPEEPRAQAANEEAY